MTKSPVLETRGLIKHYGHVFALDGTDFEVCAGEVMAVIGDNGAGKSTLIKALSGALIPNEGSIFINGKKVHFSNPLDARNYGIETVYQDLAVAPSLNIMDNLFLGRELLKPSWLGKFLRWRDEKTMLKQATNYMKDLKIGIGSMQQAVETLSGGQRQGVAVARSAAFARNVIIMDEPTAALGVKESGMVIELVRKIRERGLPVILISHNIPQVYEIADRIHIQRLGKRAALISPKDYKMEEVVAIMTGAIQIKEKLA